MSDNLNIPDIASGQANKYLLANEQKAALDAAITDLLEVDTSGGPVSISEEDYQRHVFFRVSGGDEVTLPAIRRMVAVEASGADCTLVRGSTTVELASGDIGLVYTDGSSDGLVQVGGTGGPDNLGVLATFDMSGGADGQYVASDGNGGAELRDVPEGGIEEAPLNNQDHVRNGGTWKQVPRYNSGTLIFPVDEAAVSTQNAFIIEGKGAPILRATNYSGFSPLVASSFFQLSEKNGIFTSYFGEALDRFGIASSGTTIHPGSYNQIPQPTATLDVYGTVKHGRYTVSTLPSSPGEGAQAYATNGRKTGEASGSGTGVPVYYSGGWKAFGTDQAVEA